ncbi:MAG: ABC transporter permease [Clostridiales bacterium]|nr:ABC transporter permease [Clostridiales bacterium]
MIKKIFSIFRRDLKVALRDFVIIYIIAFPVVFALIINIFTPGINDTTIKLAMIEGDNPEQVRYFKEFARVELFDNIKEVEKRVEKRDNIVAILPEGEDYYILTQGNEPKGVVDYAKALRAFCYFDISVEDSRAEIIQYGRVIPPIKKIYVNVAMMMTSILGGMLIAISIVEEKGDNTISAINVAPISRNGYIIGKSIMGIIFPVVGIITMLIITGFGDINYGQAAMMILASSIISVLVGFIEGINNDDIMNAAGNIKILFIPLLAAVLAFEMLADKWQKFFYWIPFYWTYRGNELILTKTGTWWQIISYAGIVLVISAVVFIMLAPKIRKGLE